MSEFNDVLNQKAVALKYDEKNMSAPTIVSTGKGYLAEKMIELANEHGIPVLEDNSLATVLAQLQLGAEVPEEMYGLIVDIYLYFLGYTETQEK